MDASYNGNLHSCFHLISFSFLLSVSQFVFELVACFILLFFHELSGSVRSES